MEFIFEIENSLPSDLCNKIIDLFEDEPIKYEGVDYGNQDSSIKYKISTDYKINDIDYKWKDIYYKLHNALDLGLKEYFSYIQTLYPYIRFSSYLQNTGFQIQKTKPGERFLWHNDTYYTSDYHRILTYIWYLNTLSNDECGETVFSNRAIKPLQGKLIIFPSTWTYWHQGNIPMKTKYICTGFIEENNHK